MDYSNEWLAEQTQRWSAREREFDIAAPKGWKQPAPRFDFIRQLPAYRQIMGLLAPFSWIPPWQVAGEVLLWRQYFRIHNAPVLGEVALTGPPTCPQEGMHLALPDLALYAFRDALPLLSNDTARQIFHMDAIEVDPSDARATAVRLAAGWIQPCSKILTTVREEAFCRGYAEVLPVMRFLHRCVGIEPDTIAVGPLTALAFNNKVKGLMFARVLPDYFRAEARHDIATYANRAFNDKSPEWALLIHELVKRERIPRDDADATVFEQLAIQTEAQLKAAASGKPLDPFAAVDLTANESIPDFTKGAIVRGVGSSKRAERRHRKRQPTAPASAASDDKVIANKEITCESMGPEASIHSFLNVREARDRILCARKAMEERGDTVAIARLEWIAGRALGPAKTQAEVAAKHGVTVPQLKAKAVVARVAAALFEHRVGA